MGKKKALWGNKMLAHLYLNFAAGRCAQPLWRVHKLLKALRKGPRVRKAEREPFRWLKSRKLKRVEIKSREGLRLTGHLLTHPEAERIVLMFHGWRGSWGEDCAALAKGLYEEKSSVLLVNQRAHKRSGGAYIGFGVLERYDCLEWLKYLEENTCELPIYLLGVSMGAATVLMASGMDLPERVKGIIADCGFTSPYEMVCIFAEKYLKIKEKSMVEAVNDLCRKRAGYDFKEYSTLEAVKKCRVPVFFAHGTGDDFVPWEMTMRNYEACASDKKLFLAEGAAHTKSYLSDSGKYMNAAAGFFHWRGGSRAL